jgi:hypothetical protein
MGDISLKGRGVVRKKFAKGGLSRRKFLGVMAGAAAAPDLMKALKGEKKTVKAAKVTENISNKGSGLTRSELIKKVNNKTATPQEREELDMMHEMDTLP